MHHEYIGCSWVFGVENVTPFWVWVYCALTKLSEFRLNLTHLKEISLNWHFWPQELGNLSPFLGFPDSEFLLNIFFISFQNLRMGQEMWRKLNLNDSGGNLLFSRLIEKYSIVTIQKSMDSLRLFYRAGSIIADMVATLLDHPDAECIFVQKLLNSDLNTLFPGSTLKDLPECKSKPFSFDALSFFEEVFCFTTKTHFTVSTFFHIVFRWRSVQCKKHCTWLWTNSRR